MIILGLLFGSLGSVILTRFSDGVTRKNFRGFFLGRSECPECKHRLRAKNLVPLASYLFQGGKCEYCKKKISWRYPILEIMSAVVFVFTYLLFIDHGASIIIFWLITNRLLILLLVHDIRKYELHIATRTALAITGIIGNIAMGENLWNALGSTVLFIVIFTFIYFFAKRYVKIRYKKQKEGFGEGDIYLSFIIGLYLPLVFSFHDMLFSRGIATKVLILFILMSCVLGLLRAGLQYLLNGQLKIGNGKGKEYSQLSIIHSQSKVIPFFPAMIIAFRILLWEAPYFITFIFG